MIECDFISDSVVGECRVEHGVDRAVDGVVGEVADGDGGWGNRSEGP
jgi:hypothetical protein